MSRTCGVWAVGLAGVFLKHLACPGAATTTTQADYVNTTVAAFVPVPAPTELNPTPLVHSPSPDNAASEPASAGNPAPSDLSSLLSGLPSPDTVPSPSFNASTYESPNPGSCANMCTARSGNCWCNAACVRYDDCCDDFMDLCNYTTTTTHSGFPAPIIVDFTDNLPAPDYSTETTTVSTSTTTMLDFDLPAPDFVVPPRTPGPTTTTTLGPWDFSCEDKCRLTMPTGTKSGCFCDQSCVDYNDCCFDWEDFCNPSGGFVFPSPSGRDIGCLDSDACNYAPGAEEPGDCIYLEDMVDLLKAVSLDDVSCSGCLASYDCAGQCGGSAIADECGVCDGDGLSCAHCSDSTACNFDPEYASASVVNNDACSYADRNYDCFGACAVGFDCDGQCGGPVQVDDCGVCAGNSTCCVSRESESGRLLRAIPAPGTTNPAPTRTLKPWTFPSPDAGTTPVDATVVTPQVPAPDSGQVAVPAPYSGCEGNCFILAGIRNASCFCDDNCYTYEDCCADKEQFCPFDYGQPVPSPANTSDVPAPSLLSAPAPWNGTVTDALPSPDSTTSNNFTTTTGPAPSPLFIGKEGSCDGYCLQLYGSHGKMCHCDKLCKEYDDCCFDFKLCKGVTTTTTTTTTTIAPNSCEGTDCNSTSSDGSCFCDEMCRLNEDCCDDRDDFCDHGSCFNGLQDSGEDDVDCGGNCDLPCDNCLACEYDCTGACPLRGAAPKVVDACGVCGGDSSLCAGCKVLGACNYNALANSHDADLCVFASATEDCAGNCLVELDCKGICDGSADIDACGVCGGDNATCTGCTSDTTACNYHDSDFIAIEVCQFPKSENHDCFGKCISEYDCCGVCGGDGSSCTCTTPPQTTTTTPFPTRATTVLPGTTGVDTLGTSCNGHCGGRAPSGCYCESTCKDFGDCCKDHYRVCVLTTEVTSAEPTTEFVCRTKYDCKGVCGGKTQVDSCGVCGGFGATCVAQADCLGIVGGSATVDECGVCNGFGSSCASGDFCTGGIVDCAGECDGNRVVDECDVCDGDGSTCCVENIDCAGDCGGTASLDSCSVCGGFGASCTTDYCSSGTVDCAGECNGTRTYDSCDVCDGNGTSCLPGFCVGGVVDCAGICNGTAVSDECDVCDGNGASCTDGGFCVGGLVDCNGDCNGGKVLDSCNVCGGDGSTCCSQDVDCLGICGGSATVDECGVCSGFGASCTTNYCAVGTIDCLGECDGGRVLDDCDVCAGDGSSCVYCNDGVIDCAGQCNGVHFDDECGVCGGDNSTCADGFCEKGLVDCAGKCNGVSIEDECGICDGNGATCAVGGYCRNGVIDCAGICDGTTKKDICGTCGGDGSKCKQYASCMTVKDCDGQAPSGCYCDDTCQNYGDCCEDIKDYCVFRPPPSPSPAPVAANVLDVLWQLSGSSAFLMPASEQSWALDANSTLVPTWEASISFVALPGSTSFKETMSLSGQIKSMEDLAAPEVSDDSLLFSLRTPVVYPDNRWCNIVIWTDGPGTASVAVGVELEMGSNEAKQVDAFSCGKVESEAGIECQFEIAKSWFSSQQQEISIRAVMDGKNSTSETETLTLGPKFDLPSEVNDDSAVFLMLPSYSVLSGSKCETVLGASTFDADIGSFELATWVTSIQLWSVDGTDDSTGENSVILTSVASDFYDIAFETNDNVVTLVGTTKSTVSNYTLLSSSATDSGLLQLATLTWKVSQNASAAGFEAITADDFVSSASKKVVDNEAGFLVQEGTALLSAGEVALEDEVFIDIQAEPDQARNQEFVNFAVLGQNVASKTVAIYGITLCHPLPSSGKCLETKARRSLSAGIDALACTSQNDNVVDTATKGQSACLLSVDGDETSGGDVALQVVYDPAGGTTLETSLQFRVWFPVDIAIEIDDTELSELSSIAGASANPMVFQSTKVSISAKLAVGYDFTTPRVDVSAFAVLQSSNPLVAALEGDYLHGMASGKTVVSCSSCTTSVSPVPVAVTDASSVTVELLPVVVTGISSFEVNDFVNRNDERAAQDKPFFVAESTATLQQKFSAEGDEGFLFVYLQYSDGHLVLLDNSTDLTLTPTIGPVNLSIASDTTPFFKLVVPVGGGNQNGLFGTLSYKGGNVLLSEADVFVKVSKPDIDYVTVELSESIIYPTLDTMAKSPFNLPDSTSVTATVVYIDGSTQDFSNDQRTTYLCESDVVEEVSHGVFMVAVDKNDADVMQDGLTITVNILGFTATAQLAVDIAEKMKVTPVSAPECDRQGCSGKTDFYRIQTTSGPFQRFRLSATISTALGYSYDLPLNRANVKFDLNFLEVFGGTSCPTSRRLLATSNDTATPAPSPFDQACVGLKSNECCDTAGDVEGFDVAFLAGSSGSTKILVTFREFSLSTTLTARTTTFARPSTLAITKPTGTIATETTIATDVTFTDKTRFNTDDSYYGVKNFLNFATQDTSLLSVDESGVLTPLANSAIEEYATFTVSNKAGTISTSGSIIVNLEPAAGDVDLGLANGFQFGDFADAAVGEVIEVPIRFNSGGVPLTGFQIQLFFDSNVLQAVSVANGEDWIPSVTGTLGSPSTMVQVLSSAPSSTVKGKAIEIAVVKFEVVATGDTAISGKIVESLTSNGARIGTDNRAIVAGAGLLSIGSSRRQLYVNKLWPPEYAAAAQRPQVQQRRQLGNCIVNSDNICLRGDANADCAFSLSDLDFLIRYKTGAEIDFINEAYQLSMMDVDYDGDIDGVDINFVLNALAKKYLFLHSIPNVTVSACSIEVDFALCDDSSHKLQDDSKAKVLVEIGSTNQESFRVQNVTNGTFTANTNDGLLLQVSSTAGTNGSYFASVQLESTAATFDVGVVVLVQTLTDTGIEDNLRKFPWRGSSYGFFGESGFSFDPITSAEFGCSCDLGCTAAGYFKNGCNDDGSDGGSSSCDVCSSDDINVVATSNGGVEDSCNFELCPRGKKCNFSSTSMDPIPCAGGKYQDEKGSTECKECAPGLFQPNEGQSQCVHCANSCADGYYTSGCNGTSNGTCAPCSPHIGFKFVGSGHWNDTCTLEAVEKDCPIGQFKYTEDFFNFTCINCDPVEDGFFFTDQGGFYHVCPVEACFVGCDIGHYNAGCGGNFSGECVPCSTPPNGTYFVSDGDLADACQLAKCDVEACPVGYYLEGCSGSSEGTCAECTEVDDGYFTTNGAIEDNCGVEQCQDCPVGEYLAGCGGTSPGECTSCTRESGFYIVATSGLREDICAMLECPEDCPIGYFRDGCTGTSNGTCVPCSDPPPGYVIVGDGGLEDNCVLASCSSDCPVGFYNNDCGNIDNPDGTCVPCSSPPPGFYFTGDGDVADACAVSACDAASCGKSQFLSGCNSSDPGTCVECTPGAIGQYWVQGGGQRDACEAADCLEDCNVGEYKAGCEGTTDEGECVACTNAPAGAIYTSDGGLANACRYIECDPACPTGQYVVNCTTDELFCKDCSNNGSTVCMRNGGNTGVQFNYSPLSSDRDIAKRACESEHGDGNCELGVCGGFMYFYKFEDGHCDCEKAVGTVEWVFSNKFAYDFSDSDYRSVSRASESKDIAGDTLFTRIRTKAVCDLSASWKVLDLDFGEPTVSELSASSYACGNFFYVDDGDYDDDCPAQLCNTHCPFHQYNDGCEGTNPGECVNCSSIPDGYYYSRDGDLADACLSEKCVDTCPNGHFLSDCYSGPGFCNNCSAPAEGYYLSSNGNMTNNCESTQCMTSCPAGQYLKGNCGGEDGSENYECADCVSCVAGFVVVNSCDGTTFKDVTECEIPTFERGPLGRLNAFTPENTSFILFGFNNTALGDGLFVGNGHSNFVTSKFDPAGGVGGASSIIGGKQNIVVGGSSVSYGGIGNCLGSKKSVVIGGHKNEMACTDEFSGSDSFLLGGFESVNDGSQSALVSGYRNKNTVTCEFSTIGAGQKNNMANGWSTIMGGRSGKSVSNYAAVLGGFAVKANGRFSVILGGARNTANGKFSVSGGFQSRAASVRSLVFGFDNSKFCRSIGQNTVNVCTKNGFFVNDIDLDALVRTANGVRRLSGSDASYTKLLEAASLQQRQLAVKRAEVGALQKQLSSLRRKLSYRRKLVDKQEYSRP